MNKLGRNTFELEDLNDQFWESACAVYELPGRLSVFTSEKKEYVIDLEGSPFEDFDELLDNIDLDDWTNPFGTLVHREFAATFSEAFEKLMKETDCEGQEVSPYTKVAIAIAAAMGEKILLPQTVFYGNVQVWNARKNSSYFQDILDAKKLTADDLKWMPLYANNIKDNREDGLYALLFKEENGKVQGKKYSIVYNWAYNEEFCKTDQIDSYMLYVKYYDDVLGPLRYPPYGEDDFENLFVDSSKGCTFTGFEINDYGNHCIQCDTLEEAKAEALKQTEWNGYDKDSLITDLDNIEREYRIWRRHYGAMEEFQNRYEEILKVVYEFEYPNEGSYGGGFIITALEEQLGISHEYAEEMLKYIPMILTKRKQRQVSEIMAKCREVLGE